LADATSAAFLEFAGRAMGWLSLSNEKPVGSMFRERRRKREISLDVPQKAPVCRVFFLPQKEVPVPH
jgi:hypothetical protein